MSTHYRVYANDGLGGPLDLTTPIGTTSSLTFDTPALAAPSDNTFLVRPYDTASGLENQGVDATVRIVIDATGADVTGRPNAPTNVQARPIAGAGVRVTWSYNPALQGGAPTAFKVWVQAGAIDYAPTPAAVVAYSSGAFEFTADVTGLTDGVTYTAGVRATNATGDETNTATTTATADGSGPAGIDALTATPVSGA